MAVACVVTAACDVAHSFVAASVAAASAAVVVAAVAPRKTPHHSLFAGHHSEFGSAAHSWREWDVPRGTPHHCA